MKRNRKKSLRPPPPPLTPISRATMAKLAREAERDLARTREEIEGAGPGGTAGQKPTDWRMRQRRPQK